jgi:hypothetical protein
MKKSLYFIAIITAFTLSCGTASEAKDATYEENVKAAFSEFKKGQFKNAASRLKRAVKQEPDSLNVHAGAIAWASLKSYDVDSALYYFDIAYTADMTNYDAIAGQAFALSIKAKSLEMPESGEYLYMSNDKAEEVIDDHNWSFAYNLNLSNNHLYLLEAQNHFVLGNFYDSEDYAEDLSYMLVADSLVADSIRDEYFSFPSVSSQEGQAGLAFAIEWLLTVL